MFEECKNGRRRLSIVEWCIALKNRLYAMYEIQTSVLEDIYMRVAALGVDELDVKRICPSKWLLAS
jgi:hypothetical protein